MEYVTESLTVSGKWCTIFADKRKVNFGRREDYSPLMQKTLLVEQGFEFGR